VADIANKGKSQQGRRAMKGDLQKAQVSLFIYPAFSAGSYTTKISPKIQTN
jgi:hypothetical protein